MRGAIEPRTVGKMQVTSQRSGEKLVVTLSGRLDAATAPTLDASLDLQGVRELILDFLECDFISSAGIRSIMKANQAMMKCSGTLSLRNVAPLVFEVFELTGRVFIFVAPGVFIVRFTLETAVVPVLCCCRD